MNVIELNNNRLYISSLTYNLAHETTIDLNKEENLKVDFNPRSSLYNELNSWCIWWIDKKPRVRK